jgi:hypothetical protein
MYEKAQSRVVWRSTIEGQRWTIVEWTHHGERSWELFITQANGVQSLGRTSDLGALLAVVDSGSLEPLTKEVAAQ